MLIKERSSLDVFLPGYLSLFDSDESDKLKQARRVYASIKDLYTHYVYDLKQDGKEPTFTYREFKEIIAIYNSLLSKYITNTGKHFKLPFGLGSICISKFMPRYFKPKYNPKTKTVEVNNNPHTSGYVCKFSWIKEDARLENKALFRHQANTNLKQDMFKAIMEKNAILKYSELSRESEGLTSRSKQKIKDLKDNEKNEA